MHVGMVFTHQLAVFQPFTVYCDTAITRVLMGMVCTRIRSRYGVVGHGCGVGIADPRVTRDEPY